MFAARVVEPQSLESPGMPSGHTTFPCVMTVPNCLLKVNCTFLISFYHEGGVMTALDASRKCGCVGKCANVFFF